MSHPARATVFNASRTGCSRPRAIPTVIAAYIEEYRRALVAAARAERLNHDLVKAAAVIKAGVCKPE